jgi:ABC-type multidrug transport system fused ATPase/permease subunit
MSIRDNILFGLDYDEDKYDHTIEICELTRDLEILPDKDFTEIGEKGINLSGGQKARISLARAIYADKDMVLLDDPISALDANVKKKIFENVLLGHLKEKTIVLVTHAVDFLSLVDRVVVFDEGKIVLQGSYEDVKDESYLV